LQSQKLAHAHRRIHIDAWQGVGLQYHGLALALPQQRFFGVTVGVAELDGNHVQQLGVVSAREGIDRRNHTAAIAHRRQHPYARQRCRLAMGHQLFSIHLLILVWKGECADLGGCPCFPSFYPWAAKYNNVREGLTQSNAIDCNWPKGKT
jgi:hypothetical protein